MTDTEAGIQEHWHASPTDSGFSCIVCGNRLLEERQFCAGCEPTWQPAAAEGLDVQRLARAMFNADSHHGGYECCAPPTHADATAIAREYDADTDTGPEA